MKNNKVINNVKKFSQDRQSLGNKNKSMSEKVKISRKAHKKQNDRKVLLVNKLFTIVYID